MTAAPLFKSGKAGNPIWAVSFDRNGKTVVSGDAYGVVTLWNPRTGKSFGLPMMGHHFDVHLMAQSLDGSLIAFGSGDNKVEVIALDSRKKPIKPIKLRENERVMAIVFGAHRQTGYQLFTASDDENGRILEWDLSSERSPMQVAKGTGYLYSLALSPSGKFLAGGGEDVIHIWDVTTNPPYYFSLPGHTDTDGKSLPVTSLVFFGNDSLVSGSRGELLFWDVILKEQSNAKPVREERAVKDYVRSIALSRQGNKFAAAWTRGDIILVELNFDDPSQDHSHLLKGHKGPVYSLSFSGDGTILASGSNDGTVRLWDAENGQPLFRTFVRSKKDAVRSVAFSADKRNLISAVEDGFIMSWDLDVAGWKKKAIKIASRQMYPHEEFDFNIRDIQRQPNIETALRSIDLLALKGERDKASEGYFWLVLLALSSKDTDSNDLNLICWYGSLEGFADIVMWACEEAVANAPSEEDMDNYRDTRGIARATATTPDFDGAIEDFQAFVTWSEQFPNLKQMADKRRQWIEDLKKGQNPFDDETLHELRNEGVE
jgi:WD40 repeat protein